MDVVAGCGLVFVAGLLDDGRHLSPVAKLVAQFGAAAIAIAAGLRVELVSNDVLGVAMALVWVAEAMNTAFEHLCDVVSPEFHASVQRSKDIAAAAVLVCAIAAAILGALTFWPYLAGLMR